MRIGANYHNDFCTFTVWAPNHKNVKLSLTQELRHLEMENVENGYWILAVNGIKPGTQYMYQLDSQGQRPDPASHFQPNGVFGPSEVVDHELFAWKDNGWQGLDFKDLVFYEVHVGAFTQEGTFGAMMEKIKELADFGVNAVELMPDTQFSGRRNWGYDGVFPFAVQNTYGTPDDLKALVNECHLQGVALFVDFVYNHLGPEGNCLNDYAPYFSTDKMTKWGPTVNLDGALNEGVRNFFLENTLHWLRNYHIDGIRLDAILSMSDISPKHFLQELNQTVDTYAEQTGKKLYLIAESGYNETKVLTPKEQGGYGFDAQWLDDFQHALFVLLAGEKEGYYRHYGQLDDLMEVLSDAYFFVGGQSFRRRSKNESFRWIPAYKFVVFSQNHDQVGNRLLGNRLTTLAGFEAAKLAAGMVLLSPYVPLLFMGEEYGETAPFLFFTDYAGKKLRDTIREGRRREFAAFHWRGEVPDPQSLETFEKSKLNWQQRYEEKSAKIASYYRALIVLRKNVVFRVGKDRRIVLLKSENNQVLFISKNGGEGLVIANFGSQPQTYTFPLKSGEYVKVLDSADYSWGGSGSSLPDIATAGDTHVIQGFNLAVYLEKGKLMAGESNG